MSNLELEAIMASPQTIPGRSPSRNVARSAGVPRRGGDPGHYREAEVSDPAIREAQVQMIEAAKHIAAGAAIVRKVMRSLEKHPDYRLTERRRRKNAPSAETLTLLWWIHNGLDSTLFDMPLDDAADCLLEEALHGGAEKTLREFIKCEERDLARFATRRARPALEVARAS